MDKGFPQKKVLSLVLCVAVMLSVMVMGAGAAFSDQDKIENTEAVDACSALNIIGGYEDGSYHPERNIKRSEITKMICVALNGGKEPNLATPGTPTFSDVRGTTAAWAEKYIESCVSQGIVSGVGGGRFSPAGNVTASQLAKMLLVCLGYDADIEEFTGNAWDTNVNVVATQKGIYEGLSGLDVSAALTRDNAAQMVWNALQATEVTYKYTLVSENGQLVSKVELVDKTGENGNKITLLEDKYSGAGIYEGILTGAGELGTAGKDKIGMLVVDKLNGATVDDTKDQIWTYSDDVTNLYMQYVKVLVNNKGDAYGVFPVAKENTVVTAAFSDVELVSKATSTADGKVKIDGTEYKFAWIDGDPGAAAPIQGLTNKTMNDLKKEASNSADVITFISNDGDNKFDLAIVNPMIEFGKVTYVGEDEITAAGETYDPAEDIIPDDLAKDDYVAIYKDLYTDNYKLVKADKVSGKVTGTKGNPATDVKVDGTWYALAAEKNGSFDGMVGIAGKEASNGGTYDLYCINGVAYYVDEKQAGSTDTAYVLAAPGSMDTDGNYQVKLLFADGSTKVIGADQPYNSGFVGELVTYDINDGAYELKKVASGNTAGGDSVVTLKSFDKTKKKVTTDSGDYRVADSAVVYVIYKDGGDKQKVISGETLNALGANFGTSGTAVIDDGLATVVLLKSNSYLPGSNADKLYGYVTSDVVSNKEDDISFRSFTVWTSEEESIEVKVKSESADIKKGDLISFEMTEDNFIESVKSESEADIGYLCCGVAGQSGRDIHAFQALVQANLGSTNVDIHIPSIAGVTFNVGIVTQADQQHLGQLAGSHIAVGAEPAAAHAGHDALGHAGLNVLLRPSSVGGVAHVGERGGGRCAQGGLLAAVQGHADHLADLGPLNVPFGLIGPVRIPADDVQRRARINGLSVLDLVLIRERRPGAHDHDRQHHSHTEHQAQNLLLRELLILQCFA